MAEQKGEKGQEETDKTEKRQNYQKYPVRARDHGLAGRGGLDARRYEVTNTPAYASKREAINYLEGQMTFTDLLQENGYTCALAGKWHLGNSVEPQHGFTKWFSVPLGRSTGNGQLCKNGLDSGGQKCFTNAPSIGVPYLEAVDLMKQQLARYLPQQEGTESGS